MAAEFLSLHSNNSSIVLEVAANEAPIWRYWGPRLHESAYPPCVIRDTRPIPPASLEHDSPLTIAPTFGAGWFGKAALLAHREGKQFVQQWQSCRHIASDENRIQFILEDHVAKLILTISLTLDASTDVLSIQSALKNTGESTLDIAWMAAATLPLPLEASEVISYIGQWANEFRSQTDKLTRSSWYRENTRGRTSHDCFPGAIVCCGTVTPHQGDVYGAQLAWSGNHANTIEWQHDGCYQWQLGEWLAPGEVLLPPQSTLTSPPVYAAFSAKGMNGLAQSFHDHIRRITPLDLCNKAPRLVHLNTWEAVYFDQNEADLMALASDAAALGVERFVLDDGWFQGRDHDRAGLGDWFADTKKYPQGLQPLAAHVLRCGMAFGLWIEPEMVNPDSELYRSHPEWVLHLMGRPLLTGRHQLVLDFSNPSVTDYIFDCLHSLLSVLPITYLKWDMNRDIAMAGAHERAAYRQNVIALYALLAKLNKAFPNVEIETCASGGARADAGILAFTHRVWTSDCNDALSRISIHHGALQWLPPELLGAHIGSIPAHTTGRSQSISFRAAVAMTCHFGLELDVRKLSEDDRAKLAKWIALYRRLREKLHGVCIWRDECHDGIVWQAHGTQTALILFVYRLRPTTQRWSPQIKLPMLQSNAQYRVTRIDPDATVADPLNTLFAGDWLKQVGLYLPRMLAETALILQITMIAENKTTDSQ